MLETGQRYRVDALGRAARAHDAGAFAPIVLHLLDQRAQQRGIGRRTRGVDQFQRLETGFQVAIEQHAHTGWKHQGGEELAIQLPAAHHVELSVALGCRPHGDQGERHTHR